VKSQIIIDLVKQFGICFEVKQPTPGLLFPSLLKFNREEIIPADILTHWKQNIHNQNEKAKYFGRKLIFNEEIIVPHAFNALFQVYLHDTIDENAIIWGDGIFLVYGHEVTIISFSSERKYVNICINGRNPVRLFRKLEILIDQFTGLVFPGLQKQYRFDNLCYYCLQDIIEKQKELTSYSNEYIDQKEGIVNCPRTRKIVDISILKLNPLQSCLEKIAAAYPTKANRGIYMCYAWYPDGQKNRQLQAFIAILRRDLLSIGFTVYFDLTNMTGNIKQYMESGISNNDYTIVIGTPKLKSRFEEANENPLKIELTEALNKSQQNPNMIIPLLRDGKRETSFPTILNNFLVVNFTDDKKYEESLLGFFPRGLIPTLLDVQADQKYKTCCEDISSDFKDLEKR